MLGSGFERAHSAADEEMRVGLARNPRQRTPHTTTANCAETTESLRSQTHPKVAGCYLKATANVKDYGEKITHNTL